MTAEMFLAAFLGCLCAFIVMSVFWRTVWVPLSTYLIRRAFTKNLANSDDYISVGSSYCRATPGVLDKASADAAMRHFNARETLCMSALDMKEGDPPDRLIAAASALRQATTPGQLCSLRAMAKIMSKPDGSD